MPWLKSDVPLRRISNATTPATGARSTAQDHLDRHGEQDLTGGSAHPSSRRRPGPRGEPCAAARGAGCGEVPVLGIDRQVEDHHGRDDRQAGACPDNHARPQTSSLRSRRDAYSLQRNQQAYAALFSRETEIPRHACPWRGKSARGRAVPSRHQRKTRGRSRAETGFVIEEERIHAEPPVPPPTILRISPPAGSPASPGAFFLLGQHSNTAAHPLRTLDAS